jgi:FtsH-binding integral membrane protein
MAPTCDAFFGKIFAHLAGAMAVSAASAEYVDIGPKLMTGKLWLDFFINLGILLGLLYAVQKTPTGSALKYIAFAAFAFYFGQVFKPLVEKLKDKKLLTRVLAMATGVFVGMMVLGFYDNQSLLGFGPYLLAGLLGFIVTQLIVMFFVDEKKGAFRVLDSLAVILFAVLTAFDIQVLKQVKSVCRSVRGGPDYPAHSVGLYLDFVNLFSNIADLTSD